MKKLLTYLLTFAMLITILIPAMEPASAVAGSDTLKGDIADSANSAREIPVYANVEAPEIADVFYVELGWGSMEFNIVDNGTRYYDPEEMKDVYEHETGDVTVQPVDPDGGNKVTLHNKSNFTVLSETTLKLEDEVDGQITGTFTGGGYTQPTTSASLRMKSGISDAYTFTFEATDSFTMAEAENVKIATVSVQLSKSTM